MRWLPDMRLVLASNNAKKLTELGALFAPLGLTLVAQSTLGIGEAARTELAELMGRKVHLFLHVKVRPGWEEDRGLYREIGLDWVE